jgi:cytochrome oxidase assembly protein ShyY1
VLVLLLPCAATFGLGTWQLVRREKKVLFALPFM